MATRLQTPHPNTCTRCGQALGEVCFAENLDAALAGQAWCEACNAPAEPMVTPAPKKAKRAS